MVSDKYRSVFVQSKIGTLIVDFGFGLILGHSHQVFLRETTYLLSNFGLCINPDKEKAFRILHCKENNALSSSLFL